MPPLDYIVGRAVAAGRVLAGLSQAELAKAANISVSTLKRIEATSEVGIPGTMPNNVAAVVGALEAAGVIVEADGVRLRR